MEGKPESEADSSGEQPMRLGWARLTPKTCSKHLAAGLCLYGGSMPGAAKRPCKPIMVSILAGKISKKLSPAEVYGSCKNLRTKLYISVSCRETQNFDSLQQPRSSTHSFGPRSPLTQFPQPD